MIQSYNDGWTIDHNPKEQIVALTTQLEALNRTRGIVVSYLVIPIKTSLTNRLFKAFNVGIVQTPHLDQQDQPLAMA